MLTAFKHERYCYRDVTAYEAVPKSQGSSMDFIAKTKVILTDSQFWVPCGVLIAGIILLMVLH